MLLELFEELLGAKYAVRVARNAEEAVRQLEAHEIAAVVTDLHIGRENGLALLDWVRRKYPHLSSRMLLLTGADLSRSEQFDVPVLTKPVNGQDLFAAVDEIMIGRMDADS